MTWLAAQLARKFAPVAVVALAALCAFLLVSCVVLALKGASARADLSDAHTRYAEAMRIQAEGHAESLRIAQADYEEQVAGHMAAYDTLTKELNDAETRADAVAADLRTERTRRVRRALCSGPVLLPSPGSGVDGQPALDGAALVGAAIRAGAEADARLKACVAIVKADRRGR